MLKNYFKIAIRNMLKHKGISLINISGLAIGMACCFLIMLFVLDELSYDKYQPGAERIYRIAKDFVNEDGSRLPDATTPPALAPAIQRDIPEVEYVTRIFPGWGVKFLVQYGDKKFVEERLFRVDTSFFNVFAFPFEKGNAVSAFKEVNGILLTESTARRYFGREDPMGKFLKIDNLGDLVVSGVLKDIPENSHFHFDFLVSIRNIEGGNIDNRWDWYNFYTYVKLKPKANQNITGKVQALYKQADPTGKNIFYTQALTDIHLNSNLKWEMEPNGSVLYIYIFSIIAFFVIAIACINYVNLSTAKSSLRAKEIGVRKASGAHRTALIEQFLLESVLTVFFAFLLALLFTAILLPAVNQLTQKHLSLVILVTPYRVLAVIAFILVTGLLAGIYPALYLSSFQPVIVLKGLAVRENKVFNLRKVLVILQFAISVALMVGTFVVIQQIYYIRHAKLGLNVDQVLVINDAGSLSRPAREALLQELGKVNGVKMAATANGVVGGLNWTANMKLKGTANAQVVNFIGVGYDYLNVLDITVKEGRGFSRDFPADTLNDGMIGERERIAGSIVLNERAIKDLAVPAPAIGKLVSWSQNSDTTWYLRIVGVVKDFHFASFKNKIKPFGFVVNQRWQENFTVKVSSENLSRTIGRLEEKWHTFLPERPFRYFFLDEAFARLYQAEEQFNKVIIYITILAIFIACMGLFGLTAFMIERRTKEIGIRKALGASVTGIVTLLSKDFVKLVFVAFLLACPIAWYFMDRWLDNFAYRTAIGWWVFALSGIISLIIALGTVSIQAVKAAFKDPVKALRAE